MSDINNLVLSGRLTDDPQLYYVKKGNEQVPVCNFSVASEDKFGRTSFIPVIVWRNYGESVANYLEKGQEVIVSGAIYSRKDKKTGRTFVEVHANEVKYGNKPGVTHDNI
ncbi:MULTISPECIES: single-stranded DNA-binding protein [Halalkalibacter]|jgi:single stranded DNA-binding protein|uniref:single-stranded DNA-binding protein n=1 Tax=Halalkalibacter TaxID=2893056 RepID=UPI002FCB33AB